MVGGEGVAEQCVEMREYAAIPSRTAAAERLCVRKIITYIYIYVVHILWWPV